MHLVKSKKGFTLIELLVVIAIIGILATIIMVNLLSAQRGARFRAAQANAVNVVHAADACITNAAPGDALNWIPLQMNTNPGTVNICTNGLYGTWPNMTQNGWLYVTSPGPTNLDNFDFQFQITGPNASGVTSVGTCNFRGCTFTP